MKTTNYENSKNNLTPKFQAGQQVIWICWYESENSWQVSKETIEHVTIYKDKIEYFPEVFFFEMPEDELFATFKEAMEFLQSKLEVKND
jgi:hypothetical protein